MPIIELPPPAPDVIDRLAARLRRRVNQLEQAGRSAEAVTLLVRSLSAKRTLKFPAGVPAVTVENHRLQMAAVLVISELTDLNRPKAA